MTTVTLLRSPSARRINMESRHEVLYSCAAFNITCERLRHAVGVVGTSVPKLRDYLNPLKDAQGIRRARAAETAMGDPAQSA